MAPARDEQQFEDGRSRDLGHVRFPLVVAEGVDLSFYDHVGALEGALEWIDVRDGAFQAWDAEGRRLTLGVADLRVVVEGAQKHPAHADELRGVLLRFLEATGEGDLSSEPLPSLLARAVAKSMPLRVAARRAAAQLEEQFGEEVRDLEVVLQVGVRTAADWGTDTLLLSASLESDHLYEHIDVEIATRRWFRRGWHELRTVEEAKAGVAEAIARWVKPPGTVERDDPE